MATEQIKNETVTGETTIAVMVRCARCNVTARIDAPAHSMTIEGVRWHKGITGVPGSSWSEPFSRKIRRLVRGTFVCEAVRCGTACWGCGRPLKVDTIEGHVTEHECNAKCMASKGPLCECSCGGANHGKSYAVI